MGGASKEKKDFVRNVDYTDYEEDLILLGKRFPIRLVTDFLTQVSAIRIRK
jgi:hypothetical protein